MSRTILGIEVRSILTGVASHLAHMDAEQQAAFFRVFSEELTKACGTAHLAEMQSAHIRGFLSEEHRRPYAMIGYEGQ